MKRFKLVAGVTLVFLVGVFAGAIGLGLYYEKHLDSYATDGPPMDARIRMLLDRFSHDLELTNTQRDEIEEILRDVQDKIFELRRNTFPEIEEINKKGLELIKEKLDSKQKEIFDGFHNRMNELYDRFAVKLDFPGKPPMPDMKEMKDHLELTHEQASEIEKIMNDGFKERESIMEEHRKEQPPDFSQMRQKMMESENDQRKKIEEILTPEQLKAYRGYTDERRFPRPPGPGPNPSDGPPPPPPWLNQTRIP
jgi:Spy/CpxP family protein refolding chaperone